MPLPPQRNFKHEQGELEKEKNGQPSTSQLSNMGGHRLIRCIDLTPLIPH